MLFLISYFFGHFLTHSRDSYTLLLESRLQALESKIRGEETSGYQYNRYNVKSPTEPPGLFKEDPKDPQDKPFISSSTNHSSHQNAKTQEKSCAIANILNVDTIEPPTVPQSFSVVSSLLKDSFLERAKGASASSKPQPQNLSESSPQGATTLPNINQLIKSVAQPKSRLNSMRKDYAAFLPPDKVEAPPTPLAQNGSPQVRPPLPTSPAYTPASSVSEDVDGYLLPLDIDVSEFLVFDPAAPPDDVFGQKIEEFLRIKNHIRFPISRIYDFSRFHRDRFIIPDNPNDSEWRFEQFNLYISYSIAVLSIIGLSSQGTTRNVQPGFDPYSYFYTALSHARRCRTNDPMKQVVCLTMCSLFLVRQDMARGLHWKMMDKAMHISKANGFHKKEQLERLSILDQERRLRVFWSLYQIDRLLAFERRAPFIISEHDIEVPLFADVNDNEQDEEVILEARRAGLNSKPSTLSLSLHGMRVTRIEAEIIDSIYRVDRTYEEQFSKVEPFLRRLDEWKEQCPRYFGHSQIIVEMYHARAVRLLLQPFLGFLKPTSPLFMRCMRQSGQIAQGCTEVCRVIKGYNLMSANAVFMTGLTLIYGLWLASKSSISFQLKIIEDIRLCTCCLYALAERSSMFAHYRDTIDNLAAATIKHVTELSSQRCAAVGSGPAAAEATNNDTPFTVPSSVNAAYPKPGNLKHDDVGYPITPFPLGCKAEDDPLESSRPRGALGLRERFHRMHQLKRRRELEQAQVQAVKMQKLTHQDQPPLPPQQLSPHSGYPEDAAALYGEGGPPSSPQPGMSPSSLNARYGLGGSYFSWWSNIEQRLQSNESSRTWVSALGSHDGVTNWIQDLSNFAKQHLGTSDADAPDGGGVSSPLTGASARRDSGGELAALYGSLPRGGSPLSASLSQQHQAPSPLNFLSSAAPEFGDVGPAASKAAGHVASPGYAPLAPLAPFTPAAGAALVAPAADSKPSAAVNATVVNSAPKPERRASAAGSLLVPQAFTFSIGDPDTSSVHADAAKAGAEQKDKEGSGNGGSGELCGGSTTASASNAGIANISIYETATAVPPNMQFLEEYTDFSYDINWLHYNDLVTWTL